MTTLTTTPPTTARITRPQETTKPLTSHFTSHSVAVSRLITPTIAAAWLEEMQYTDQRALRQRVVDQLAEEMRRGLFSQGTTIRIVTFRGRHILIDGQHRLWAIVESGVSIEFVVVETPVSSEEEIAWLYGNIDIGLRRTPFELYGPLHLPGELGLTKTDVSALSAAMNFMASGCMRYGGNANRMHRDDMLIRMRLYAPVARQYTELLAGCEQRRFRIRRAAMRAPSLSVALLTLRFALPRAQERGDPDVAEFWRGMIFDDGIKIGDPRKLAHRHLWLAQLSKPGTGAEAINVSPAYSARYIGNCFNAYMERRELKMTKVFDDSAPLRLYGVPIDPSTWW